jgi:hypothetical protein
MRCLIVALLLGCAGCACFGKNSGDEGTGGVFSANYNPTVGEAPKSLTARPFVPYEPPANGSSQTPTSTPTPTSAP